MKSRRKLSPGCQVIVLNQLNKALASKALASNQHNAAQDEEHAFVGSYLALADVALRKGIQGNSKPLPPKTSPPKAA